MKNSAPDIKNNPPQPPMAFVKEYLQTELPMDTERPLDPMNDSSFDSPFEMAQSLENGASLSDKVD